MDVDGKLHYVEVLVDVTPVFGWVRMIKTRVIKSRKKKHQESGNSELHEHQRKCQMMTTSLISYHNRLIHLIYTFLCTNFIGFQQSFIAFHCSFFFGLFRMPMVWIYTPVTQDSSAKLRFTEIPDPKKCSNPAWGVLEDHPRQKISFFSPIYKPQKATRTGIGDLLSFTIHSCQRVTDWDGPPSRSQPFVEFQIRLECVELKPLKSPTSRHTTSTPCRKAWTKNTQEETFWISQESMFLLFVLFCFDKQTCKRYSSSSIT